MTAALQSLWKNDKVRFLLWFIPLVCLALMAVFIPGIREILARSAQRIVDAAQRKSDRLQSEAGRADMNAREAVSKADGYRRLHDNTEGDENWHLK
jgi:zona occludens toxin (predicted ATPase)